MAIWIWLAMDSTSSRARCAVVPLVVLHGHMLPLPSACASSCCNPDIGIEAICHRTCASRPRALIVVADRFLAAAQAPRHADFDSAAIPPTVRQLSRLASSPEASALSGALTAGVLRGYAVASGSTPADEVAFLDRLLNRILPLPSNASRPPLPAALGASSCLLSTPPNPIRWKLKALFPCAGCSTVQSLV
ncbi:hypothetical protein E2562_025608 [Oryza meyeriana var. granulata]|uniref:Uncharacterized protein n=1 Tax=Oryza meyeriana var. granulata TaxID=110450 RepID=A0A6G1FC98_9ORYZ|nr:hypothetical protein E2562_025608 [Oryza meyeriana var. granulata]KAF0934503.1 hypothetical protein E2562_025608 [Oryza meyeriana var. granulata]KAF0934504.1 hypothetical protein E2562_025608 [Oryza meyeriana var. granulata]KAF0934505.1 hypothetical protein E2562_025608 [Oryza meyeriana var. granulata]KAF0934506.1 hypothetical protein E2562_025608 [Oryza meyeriana var. granulata]